MRNSRAFTLVEVLVAILILAVGLLALISTAAWSARTIRFGWQVTTTAALAEQELAVFHSRPCSLHRAGQRMQGPFRLEWAAERSDDGHQLVTLVIESSDGARQHADTFSAIIPC